MPRILLIEDHEMNRDMLVRRLERRGFTLLSAANGIDGFQLAQAEAPDLILLDMDMPLMTGWEVAGLLKGNAATASIPIIALTALAMPADEQKAKEAGCDDYESKPADLDRLLAKINALLPP